LPKVRLSATGPGGSASVAATSTSSRGAGEGNRNGPPPELNHRASYSSTSRSTTGPVTTVCTSW
jgi:hypothetical protein